MKLFNVRFFLLLIFLNSFFTFLYGNENLLDSSNNQVLTLIINELSSLSLNADTINADYLRCGTLNKFVNYIAIMASKKNQAVWAKSISFSNSKRENRYLCYNLESQCVYDVLDPNDSEQSYSRDFKGAKSVFLNDLMPPFKSLFKFDESSEIFDWYYRINKLDNRGKSKLSLSLLDQYHRTKLILKNRQGSLFTKGNNDNYEYYYLDKNKNSIYEKYFDGSFLKFQINYSGEMFLFPKKTTLDDELASNEEAFKKERIFGFFVKRKDGKFLVVYVDQGKPFYNAGIKVGDIILKINNISSENITDKIFLDFAKRDVISLNVLSNNVEKTYNISK